MGGETAEMDLLEKKRELKATTEIRENEEVEVQRRPVIPRHRWVMNGAVMFGRLPEQYYSLTWFLSPVLGLFFTPVIGSTSDRCTLRWGRRRPFILALCVGVLLGVALFLNGALIGLSVGDTAGSQPIGIALTVVGVIVLDFSADAADGPIRAYLLDVADTEEQDMALNIHAFSAGLGGAVGYMLGGLDWTGTALGQAFKAQEQVLFLFTAVVFIVSVILHMFSIPEKPYSPRQPGVSQNPDSTSQSSLKTVDHTAPMLDVIMEEDSSSDDSSDSDKEDMDLLGMERVRSKSDSVLAMPDATIEMDPDLHPDNQHFLAEVDLLPEVHEDLEDVFSPTEGNSDISLLHVPITCNNDSMNGSACNQHFQTVPTESKSLVKAANCSSNGLSSPHLRKSVGSPKLGTRLSTRRPTFYRQPSFTFSYYGRVGSQRYRLKRNTAAPLSPKRITSSRSLSDLSELQKEVQERERKFSMSSLSSEESSTVSEDEEETTLRLLWLSMLKMPTQLWRLCICHLLTWFAYIAQAVFFTDFMGQVIFQGDPIAPANSTEQQNYLSGVQMGCWGLVVYAATSAICSAILQKYLDHFDLSVKIIYIVGTLSFSVGTAVMAIFPNVYVAMVMISSMGVISMSISYCPYALLGQYHEIKEYIYHSPANTRRGFGIDCAILSCQVYISQILVASALGAVVDAVGSVRVIPVVASGGSFLGFLTACFLVIYPDVEPSSSEQNKEASIEKDQNGEQNKRLALLNLTNHEGAYKTQSEETAA
ncbi:solute carrier family 45 member 4 isoform X2 [Boleophthalmus pectinirostris]|uniref:solute carrier family 45 member 4 isoform X2 n=1 Tax=Boleophthalmus pectinirostris TaxID=150288 RepID=UPI002431C27B|nr:solute carrier family 45 member 4 isoform X2 [Boleophthalmus pectinirostris]